jgi:hypothetical protein
MTGPEATIEQHVNERVENELGLLNSKLGKDGMPDRCYWMPQGKPILIEYKAPGEQPTKRQWYWINFLRGLSYDVQWFDDADRAFAYLAAAVASYSVHDTRGEVHPGARQRRRAGQAGGS